jgi:hypothetical protein
VRNPMFSMARNPARNFFAPIKHVWFLLLIARGKQDVLQLTAHGAMASPRLRRATKLPAMPVACNGKEKLPRVLRALYLCELLPRPEASNQNRCLPARKAGSPAAIVCRGQCTRAGMAGDFLTRF